jgi:Cof subfamily protein (haloacid dehalogenase superfamily)
MKEIEITAGSPKVWYAIDEHTAFAGAPFHVSACFFDIDGTVVGALHAISPRTKRAIAELKGRGVIVGFATGRASFATQEVGLDVGIDGTSMFFAGSLIQNVATGKVLYRVDLGEESINQLLQLSARRNYHLEFYTESDFFVERLTEELVIHQQYCSRPAVVTPLRELAARTPLVKAVMMTTVGSGEALLRSELAQIDGIAVTYSYGAVHADIVFANIVDARATREAAFDELLRLTKCSAEQVATFGDSEADCAFLRAARFGVATGNAVEAAKEAATFITSHVDDGGVGLAIEKLFLGPPVD